MDPHRSKMLPRESYTQTNELSHRARTSKYLYVVQRIQGLAKEYVYYRGSGLESLYA